MNVIGEGEPLRFRRDRFEGDVRAAVGVFIIEEIMCMVVDNWERLDDETEVVQCRPVKVLNPMQHWKGGELTRHSDYLVNVDGFPRNKCGPSTRRLLWIAIVDRGALFDRVSPKVPELSGSGINSGS